MTNLLFFPSAGRLYLCVYFGVFVGPIWIGSPSVTQSSAIDSIVENMKNSISESAQEANTVTLDSNIPEGRNNVVT